MTLEQFLRLPEEEPALEYWDGEVTQKVHRGLAPFLLSEAVAPSTTSGVPAPHFAEVRQAV